MLRKLKKVKIKDFFAIFMLIIALPISLIVRLVHIKKPIWLVCELKNTAHDNGYHFFKYIRTNYPNINCYYAIDKKCLDYSKISEFGNVIQFGSLRHWVYYLASEYNISSHKEGNPNHAIFTVIHLYLKLLNNRVFLQHGITKDDAEMFYYKNTYFKYFICGARREYEFIGEKFGYPEKNLIYTGFSRFDNLYDCNVDPKKVLVIPTWRRWFELSNDEEYFSKSSYFKAWNGFLNNKKLLDYLKSNDIKIEFFPHYGVRKFAHLFSINKKFINMISDDTVDLQSLLKESSLMITDYSSVYMDFAYMKKPLIYYQFDLEDYRKSHFKEGYFNYNNDGFGDVIINENELVDKLISYCENKYKVEKKYMDRMNSFYEIHDKNNSERIYKQLLAESKYEN